MTFDLFNDRFLLYFSFESPQSTFEGFARIYFDVSQILSPSLFFTLRKDKYTLFTPDCQDFLCLIKLPLPFVWPLPFYLIAITVFQNPFFAML